MGALSKRDGIALIEFTLIERRSPVIQNFFLPRYYKSNPNLYPLGLEQDIIDDDFDENQETVEIDFVTTLNGRCRTLETYNSSQDSNPGILNVEKGEELHIIQRDLGSGYTCVQSKHGTGFVPTSKLYFF